MALVVAALIGPGAATAHAPFAGKRHPHPHPHKKAGPAPGVVVSLPLSRAEIGRIRQLGVRTVRFFAYEASTPVSTFDETFRQLRQAGLKAIVVVVGDPRNPPTTPQQVAAYADWVGRAAARFRGQVAGWEIWNEEDYDIFWAGAEYDGTTTRDASAYTRLLVAAHAAIRQADPHVPVVLGGLTGNDYRFLESVYANGGGGAFDVVGTHTDIACNLRSPYDFYRDPTDGHVSQWVFLGYRSLRAVMLRHGERRKPIWMTELGWSTSRQSCDNGLYAGHKRGGVSESAQARFITEAYHCLAPDRYVQRALVFDLRDDRDPGPNFRYGLLRPNGSAKPGFRALQTYAHRGDVLPRRQGCGDFRAPGVSVRLVDGGRTKDLILTTTSRDGSGVVFVDIFLDGRRVRHYFDGRMPRVWTTRTDLPAARALRPGSHVLLVKVTDYRRNVATVRMVVLRPRYPGRWRMRRV